MATKKTNSGAFVGKGMNLFDWLLIVFVYLKLTHQIDWSWWWVTAPVWGTIVVLFVVFVAKELLTRDGK